MVLKNHPSSVRVKDINFVYVAYFHQNKAETVFTVPSVSKIVLWVSQNPKSRSKGFDLKLSYKGFRKTCWSPFCCQMSISGSYWPKRVEHYRKNIKKSMKCHFTTGIASLLQVFMLFFSSKAYVLFHRFYLSTLNRKTEPTTWTARKFFTKWGG